MSISDFLKKHKRKLLALGLAAGAIGATGAVKFRNKSLQNKILDADTLNKLKKQNRLETLGFHVAHQLITVPRHKQLTRAVKLGRKLGYNISKDQEADAHTHLITGAIDRGITHNALISGFALLRNRMQNGHWTPQNSDEMKRYMRTKRIGQSISLLASGLKNASDHFNFKNRLNDMDPHYKNNK